MSDAAKNALTKPQVRKIADKMDDIRRATPAVRDLAMSVIGVSSPKDLLVHVFTANPKDVNILAEIDSIAKADPMDAVVNTMELGKDQMKAIWKILTALGLVRGSLNQSEPKAAKAIAQAVHGMPFAQKEELTSAAALLSVN